MYNPNIPSQADQEEKAKHGWFWNGHVWYQVVIAGSQACVRG